MTDIPAPRMEVENVGDDLAGLIEATRLAGRTLDSNDMLRDAIEALCNSMEEKLKALRTMTETSIQDLANRVVELAAKS